VPEILIARALLFDMDGTLVDSDAVVRRIWANFADRFGYDTEEIISIAQGVRMLDTIEAHAPEGTDVAALHAELSALELDDTSGIIPVPGAVEFLAALPATSVALVTSAARPLVASRMGAIDLPVPATIVTAEDVARGKPAPDAYLRAAELLGVAPEDAIVFEDAEAGIRAGLAAGMRVVVVGTWESATTVGLPRVTDYASVGVSIDGDVLRLAI
jgi:mannitol-1-/sugar-/sorbitol-6-phosphatase